MLWRFGGAWLTAGLGPSKRLERPWATHVRRAVVWSGVLWLWLRGRGGGLEVGQRGMMSALTCFAWRLPIPCAELITFSCLFAH